MTIPVDDIIDGPYLGNNLADTYSYNFPIESKNQLSVYETDDSGNRTLLTVDTDYTVSGIGDENGGSVVRVSGNLPTNYIWYIRSNREYTQQTSFDSQGGFFPDVHEKALNNLTILTQQLKEQIGRSLRLDPGNENAPLSTLPTLVESRFLRVNSAATGFDLFTGSGDPVSVEVPVASYDDFRNDTGGFNIGDYSDGQIIYFTNDLIAGPFIIETNVSPADNGGTIIRSTVDTSRYAKRIYDGRPSVKWWGAAGDGTTDDATALQAAVTAFESVFLPAGTYLSSAEITLQRNQYLIGEGREKTIIRFTGATRGFSYDSASKVDSTLTFDSFMTQGNSSALDLFYLVNTGSVNFDNCIVRNTSGSCIYLGGEIISFSYRNSYFEAFENYGLNSQGTLTGLLYFENVKANGFTSNGTTPSANSAVIFVGSGGLSQTKLVQINVNGGTNINTGGAGIGALLRSDAGSLGQIKFDQCYTEFIADPSVLLSGTASVDMLSATECNFSSDNSISIDLNNGVAHDNVTIARCRRPSSSGFIFDPGSTTNWAFLQGSRESGTQFIAGYTGLNNVVNYGTAGIRHLTELTTVGFLNALGGINIDNSCTMTQSSGDITIGAAQVGKSIIHRVAGADQVVTATNVFRPATDNAKSLGNASFRWSEVFSATGTINTSDEREKENVRPLSELERNVARALKENIKMFNFKNKKEIYCGLIAQEVEKIFSREGLNAEDYGILNKEGDTYGLRYDQVSMFILSLI